MKGLSKICPLLLFGHHRGIFNRNRNVLLLAAYSRSSSNSRSPYKIVQAKIKSKSKNYFVISLLRILLSLKTGNDIEPFSSAVDATTKSVITQENGANWELFPVGKNNRFFLKEGLVGPAYVSFQSTFNPCDLNELVDFENKDKSKLHISFNKCPVLIRKNLAELFPGKHGLTRFISLIMEFHF